MSESPVFRKVSLDRLSSPEQLDQLMQVTDPRGWIALAATGVILLTAIVWSVAGTVPETVSGSGMLMKTGGVFEVAPLSGGRVTDLSVGVGDTVHEGQAVARIAQPDLADKLQQARTALAELRAQQAELVKYGDHDLKLQTDYLAQQRTNLEQSIAAAEQSLRWTQDRLTSEQQLATKGLLTNATVLATRQQYEANRQRLSDSRGELTQIAAKLLALENQRRREVSDGAFKIQQQVAVAADVERQLDAASRVITPYTGRILEVMSGEGSLVAPGEPILNLDLTGNAVRRLEVVLFVASGEGKRIKPGMAIQVAPSTVRQEEFGLMLGRVTYVSDFPATAKGMQRILKNDRVVNELAGHDAPYEVHAELLVDPGTVSQYKWSSSKGPPIAIRSGTMATANIEVAARRPIEMVIPILKQYAGL